MRCSRMLPQDKARRMAREAEAKVWGAGTSEEQDSGDVELSAI